MSTEDGPDADAGATRDPSADLRWDALRLEYEHLRSEIEQSIRNQVRVLGYGGATLSLLIGLGIGNREFAIVIALPFLAFFFFMLWSIEQTRMMRAGDYISGLEDRAREEILDGDGLGWEGWLSYRSKRESFDIYDLHYYSQYGVLGGFVVVLVVAALFLWFGSELLDVQWPVALTGPFKIVLTVAYLLMAVVCLGFLLKTVRHGDVRTSLRAYRAYQRE
ncbi:hypothetical protein [Haloplanus halophilus]|uniref:hypothetical protein n=1 Tax=Haloplanus halophilus TaxID=2949993 RepID=UPI00203DDB99|nr:hypothetical protein [Haloplanus sp. GDY1]